MTQAQLDMVNFSLQSEKFQSIHCQFPKRRIICVLNENVYLILKRTGKNTFIFLQNGKKALKLTPEIFDLICDCKFSVSFLKSYLEQNSNT